MGFDASGEFLLTVSHSGRGVFAVGSWERVARDSSLAYSDDGMAIGIGPIDGQMIEVQERSEQRDRITMLSPDGSLLVIGESDGITISEQAAAPNRSLTPVPKSEIPVRGSEG